MKIDKQMMKPWQTPLNKATSKGRGPKFEPEE
jgi:hypothetical protein